MLPVEIELAKPDYNNKIYYTDKGKGFKEEIKANKFGLDDRMRDDDPKKKDLPGPGAYGINKLEVTTFSPKPPAYSLASSG